MNKRHSLDKTKRWVSYKSRTNHFSGLSWADLDKMHSIVHKQENAHSIISNKISKRSTTASVSKFKNLSIMVFRVEDRVMIGVN